MNNTKEWFIHIGKNCKTYFNSRGIEMIKGEYPIKSAILRAHNEGAVNILSDYKKALEEELKKKIKLLRNKKYTHKNMSIEDNYTADELEKVLKLLDTVKPL